MLSYRLVHTSPVSKPRSYMPHYSDWPRLASIDLKLSGCERKTCTVVNSSIWIWLWRRASRWFQAPYSRCPLPATHRWYRQDTNDWPTLSSSDCYWWKDEWHNYNHLRARSKYKHVRAVYYRCWWYRRHSIIFIRIHNSLIGRWKFSKRSQPAWSNWNKSHAGWRRSASQTRINWRSFTEDSVPIITTVPPQLVASPPTFRSPWTTSYVWHYKKRQLLV